MGVYGRFAIFLLILASLLFVAVVYSYLYSQYVTLVLVLAASWSFVVMVSSAVARALSFALPKESPYYRRSKYASYTCVALKWLVVVAGFYVLWQTEYKHTHQYPLIIGVFLGCGMFLLACLVSNLTKKKTA